ncbi:MAG TPA: GNAT family N-acetyltransferase [Phenylobacterium sp.]|nr:GNAT family N-acetyltransferase [Phenylobacterium sp.]
MQIETPRLLLRPTTAADRPDLHGLEQDPEVMRHLNGGRPTPLEPDPRDDEAGFLMPRGGEAGVWTVLEPGAGGFVGWVSLLVQNDVGYLGYRFRRAAWGRGLATEAASAAVADGFGRLGLARIVAQTMAVNLASRKVMQRLGMRHVRTFFLDLPDPLPGSEQGDVEYELAREDWRSPA